MSNRSNRRRRNKRQSSSLFSSPLFLLGIGVLLIAGGIVLALNNNGAGTAQAATSEERADTAPDFSLATLDGEQIALSNFRGQYVLVNFWATWCPPCRAELPDLVSYYESHADQGFMLIGVNEQEPPATVEAYLSQSQLEFPVVLDSDGRVMNRYGVTGMPSSFLVNPEGQIVRSWTGMINRAMLESTVTPLLNGQG
jgi:peroxiredoxin